MWFYHMWMFQFHMWFSTCFFRKGDQGQWQKLAFLKFLQRPQSVTLWILFNEQKRQFPPNYASSDFFKAVNDHYANDVPSTYSTLATFLRRNELVNIARFSSVIIASDVRLRRDVKLRCVVPKKPPLLDWNYTWRISKVL